MLDVVDLAVRLDGNQALDGATLHVDDGEVVAVLGPSGSGKTTLLRVIAGLVQPDAGDVTWDGNSIMEIPTHRRGFGLMFQGYALFPHLTVVQNVAFGLRLLDLPADEIAARSADALSWVGLTGFADRDIAGLSGGERQRVALARTLAPQPQLVMLDEPLGALDRSLRDKLIGETRQILAEHAATAVIVTHDRDEAAQLSDRLALMHSGRIVQTGTLDHLLANPASDWVRDFLE